MTYIKITLVKQDEKSKRNQNIELYYNSKSLKQTSRLYRKTQSVPVVYADQGTLNDWNERGWNIS